MLLAHGGPSLVLIVCAFVFGAASVTNLAIDKGMEMNRELRSFLNVYLGLVLLTVCSLLLADSGSFAASISRHMNEIFVLVIAGVKIFLVSNYFMELRFSPKWLRGLMAGWICLLTAVLVAFVIPFPPT